MQPAKRLASLPPYPFARLEKSIAESRAKGTDVIRLDIGSPDLAPTPEIIQTLSESAANEHNHGYPGFAGTPRLREAVATYYRNRFRRRDQRRRRGPAAARLERGYRQHGAGLRRSRATWRWCPTRAIPRMPWARRWPAETSTSCRSCRNAVSCPDLSAIPDDVRSGRACCGSTIPITRRRRWRRWPSCARPWTFAGEHNILLCLDNPYASWCYDGYTEHPYLSIPGAKEVAVEFNSLSKTYNMAGWRIGMAVGQAQAIAHLAAVEVATWIPACSWPCRTLPRWP